MHRTLVVASVTIVALASSATSASAQERAIRDSVAPSAVDAGPVVDTAAHSPTTPRESVRRNNASGILFSTMSLSAKSRKALGVNGSLIFKKSAPR